MRITPYLTDDAVLAEVGARLEAMRLARNLSQQEVASQGGVARKAVQRLESGQPITTTNLVRVLRSLGLSDALDQLVPEPLPNPVDLLKLHGKARKRASGQRRKRAPESGEPRAWRWGDEPPAGDR
jgi:transcriptional regulator with XRE-family HTH domain